MKLNIKDRVDKLGISKNKLAQQLKISYPTMLDMYNGESTSIKLDTLEKLCNILQCTPNDIFIFDPSRTTPPAEDQPTIIHLSDLHFMESDKNNITDTLQQLLDTLKVEVLNGTDGKRRGYIFLDGFDENRPNNLIHLKTNQLKLSGPTDKHNDKSDTK